MDNQGDAVIVWQSLDQASSSSGYDVYLQRYNPAGIPVGGTDQVEMLTFTNYPVGTFTLEWNGTPTSPIAYSGNTAAITGTIQTALADLGLTVQVTAITGTEILITFIGKDAARPIAPVYMEGQSLNSSSGAGAVITLQVTVKGATGETRVNDTTAGNQTFADVSMAQNGTFVVTWMSSGEAAGDTASETSIYAKQFDSNDSLRTSAALSLPQTYHPVTESLLQTQRILSVNAAINAASVVTAATDGGFFTGVVMITVQATDGSFIGSGCLLSNGLDVLTDAHVVWDDVLNQPVSSANVTFNLPSGQFTVTSTDIIVNPAWNPNDIGVGDIAIIVLPQAAPAAAQRYQHLHGELALEPGCRHPRLRRYGHGHRGREHGQRRRVARHRERVPGLRQ